ncbi:N-acetylmuramoyl-L-alanine amidase [Saccharibacillus sp. O23]|uniref:N-acetylmuramoyl-L-alanine amidase family protein n=1 Tax=Saccharibacillus sp. O23 TaxID=2009338 RepID=UPI000B4E6DC1|nr:N-acetylmuramoyl-L-alanine amidase family protein [Saccharibacillus sp. O23]OWR30022.1 N-acetylmuramoyl-L-alanine amidase [Saccharibacillus sp. O23]
MNLRNNFWKKTAAAALALLLLLLLALPTGVQRAAAANVDASIMLDGKTIDGAQPLVVAGTTMVPIRVVSEQLGYAVKWNRAEQRITIGSPASPLVLTIGSLTADSGSGSVKLLQAPFVQAETTYVPLRFVGSQMGLSVKWDQAAHTVYLESPPPAPSETPVPTTPPDSSPMPTSPAAPPVVRASIDGLSFADNRLTISTSAAEAPKVQKLDNPSRIVVDLPGTAFGSGMTQSGTMSSAQSGTLTVEGSALVKQVRFSMFDSANSTIRFVLDLNQTSVYNVYTQGNLVVVDLNGGAAPPVNPTIPAIPGTAPTPPVPTSPPVDDGRKTVVIDPGHGDHDPGGLGVTGVQEKDIVLAVGLKVADLLRQEPNINLIMTRGDDTFVTLDGRAQVANNAQADLYLSIHANIANTASAGGTETYYADAKRSKTLSDIIQKHVQAATGFKDRGSKQANYLVIRKTTMPAALVELGFLSNAAEESAMNQSDFQQKVAEAIVAGIKEYLGIN